MYVRAFLYGHNAHVSLEMEFMIGKVMHDTIQSVMSVPFLRYSFGLYECSFIIETPATLISRWNIEHRESHALQTPPYLVCIIHVSPRMIR